MNIKGQRVLITGANRGIGLALAKQCASRGAHVFMGSRQEIDCSVIEELKILGAKAVKVVPLDLSSPSLLQVSLENLKSEEIDILVNNAGILSGGVLEEQDSEEIYNTVQVNLSSMMLLTATVLKGMIERGHGKIVNNASVSGIVNFPCASVYNATKAGVIAFTQSLRTELKGTGVSTLLLITPGVKTRLYDEIPKKFGRYFDLSMLGQPLSPEEWAEATVDAIASDEAQLYPLGLRNFAIHLARFLPGVYESLIETSFSRHRRRESKISDRDVKHCDI